jgi:rhodanese-related sulfurtransferase
MPFFAALLFAVATEIPRVTPEELRSLMQKGEAEAIDVRGSVPWETGHIDGAIWMPLGVMSTRADELSHERQLITYCACKSEETSLQAAKLLLSLGFEHVGVLTGGWVAWKNAGLPTASEIGMPQEATAPVRRLAPPASVSCDRNSLTAYAGKVSSYRRVPDTTTIKIATDENTNETVTITHKGSDDPSRYFLIDGTPFTSRDWNRIEAKKDVLVSPMRAVAWVCKGGVTFVDFHPVVGEGATP